VRYVTTTELTWLKIILRKSSFANEDRAMVSLCLILRSAHTSFVPLTHTNGRISLQMNGDTNQNVTFFWAPSRIESEFTFASSSNEFPTHGGGRLS